MNTKYSMNIYTVLSKKNTQGLLVRAFRGGWKNQRKMEDKKKRFQGDEKLLQRAGRRGVSVLFCSCHALLTILVARSSLRLTLFFLDESGCRVCWNLSDKMFEE